MRKAKILNPGVLVGRKGDKGLRQKVYIGLILLYIWTQKVYTQVNITC